MYNGMGQWCCYIHNERTWGEGLAVPVLPVTPMTMKMVPPVPMLMNVSMTMTICQMLRLTALRPLVVTNVHAKLHIGKANGWSAMMVAQDVLTSTSVPPEPIIGQNSECNNIDGDHFCTCVDGYYSTNNDISVCANIDECAEGTHNCNVDARCTHTDGCFECAWKSGFAGEDYDVGSEIGCADVNECAMRFASLCGDNATCV